jgi:hypothetical protein
MLRVPLRRFAVLVIVAALLGAGASKPVAPSASPPRDPPSISRVGARFRNVHLRLDDIIVLEIRRLDGALIGRADRPPVFDDQNSFTLRIDSGELAMSPASLSNLLNNYVLAYRGAPLKDLDISIEEGLLKTKGKLHKGIDLPFTILAEATSTPEGLIRLHPKKVKAAGIPTRGLMHLFGIELDDLIKLKGAPGIRIADDDFLLDPGRLLPAPRIAGRLTGLRIERSRIVQIFGSGTAPRAPTPPDAAARNFMHYHGGTLRFGKLTMSDTDMQLIDADPRDPFDFYPEHYVKQLVAGYSKNTPKGGLKVYMPDYGQAAGTDLRPR